MKLVIRTAVFHLLCIIVFACIYFYFSEKFQSDNIEKNVKYKSFSDFLLLSTTIQAGVGISETLPITIYGKIFMIIQQLIMISISVLTIYIFTK